MDNGYRTGQNIETMFHMGEVIGVTIEQLKVRQGHTPTGEDTLDGDMTIEALPSWYGGTTFRSKLEADWACTLDTFSIVWEYEPETITLPSGKTYVPDFWLPEIGTWLEVKGPGVPRVEKAYELAETLACRCKGRCSCDHHGGALVLIGHIPTPLKFRNEGNDSGNYWVRARRHETQQKKTPGHLAWTTAHGPDAYLSHCRQCGAVGWAPLRYPGCRRCRTRHDNTPVHKTGSSELFFVNSEGTPQPASRSSLIAAA